jgi:hypothetical protein
MFDKRCRIWCRTKGALRRGSVTSPGVKSYCGNRIRMYAGPVSWVSNYVKRDK